MNLSPYASALDHIAALEQGTVTSRALLEDAVKRHKALKSTINAVVVMDLNRARRDADAADARRAKGERLGPLGGLPMTVKECFDLSGHPATAANAILSRRNKNCHDAPLVAHLRKAGAIIWGKTNVPFMLGDGQTFNRIWGTTNNPYDTARTPGGSSGGAAAALAAGITPLELGSDIGGSLRNPAHYCGVAALKPTWGVLNQAGHVPPLPGGPSDTDLNVAGPMARTIGDLRLLWRVLSGRWTPAEPATPKLALWTQEEGWPVSREVSAQVLAAAKRLEDSGVSITGAKPDIATAELTDTYMRLLCAVLAHDLPKGARLFLNALRPVNRFLSARTAQTFAQSRYAYYLTLTPGEVALAQQSRDVMKRAVERFFDAYTALILPVAPTPAFAHMQGTSPFARPYQVDGERRPYFSWLHWIVMASALHLPAVSVRCGQSAAGLPIGLQIVGPWGSEERLLDIAELVERQSGGFQPPPIDKS
jgi:amidase